MPRLPAELLLAFPLTLVACAPRNFEPAPPVVRPGPMPAGAEWTGVYTSPTHGDIHLLVTDQRADGGYRRADGVLGKLWGAIDGNQIRFVWREQRRNDYGHRMPWFGRGYVVYTAGGAGRADEIHGQWGLEYSEVGEALTAIKRQGVSPDIWALGSNADGNDDSDEDGDYFEFDEDGFDDDE